TTTRQRWPPCGRWRPTRRTPAAAASGRRASAGGRYAVGGLPSVDGSRRAGRPVAPLVSPTKGAAEAIREAVTSWPGVEAAPHRFGGTEYRYGRRELGHVHG